MPTLQLHKLHPKLRAQLIPLIGLAFTNADRQPNTIPVPATETFLKDTAHVSNEAREIVIRSQSCGTCSRYGEDEDKAAQDGEDLAGLVGEEG